VCDIQSDLVGLGDMAENVLFPARLDIGIEVQIKPAVGDAPRLRSISGFKPLLTP
jgi:hypothetical protein|tara:strand:- start:408 stop:572 length:165 start_codon:yes stop_codon:yes gene_type:complete